jgi:hypothetical protein
MMVLPGLEKQGETHANAIMTARMYLAIPCLHVFLWPSTHHHDSQDGGCMHHPCNRAPAARPHIGGCAGQGSCGWQTSKGC